MYIRRNLCVDYGIFLRIFAENDSVNLRMQKLKIKKAAEGSPRAA